MFLEVPNFNKYLYYFMCLLADSIYLIWIAYCMFNSKLLRNIAIFSIIYMTLTFGLIILYFYLGDIYSDSLGLNETSVAKWSRYDLISIFSGVGVFMAPIAVLLGFNAWKKQQFESSKIKTIESIKEVLTMQNNITNSFRLSRNCQLILSKTDENWRVYENREREWSDQFEQYRMDISNILQRNNFYFGKKSVITQKLYELNNNTLKIIHTIESSAFHVKGVMMGGTITSDKPEDENLDSDFLYKRCLYILEPHYAGLKQFIDDEHAGYKVAFVEFEQKEIRDYFNQFFDFLNEILEQTYQQ